MVTRAEEESVSHYALTMGLSLKQMKMSSAPWTFLGLWTVLDIWGHMSGPSVLTLKSTAVKMLAAFLDS